MLRFQISFKIENENFKFFLAYLKEPQATPLVPATVNQNQNLISAIGQNPTMIIIGIIATVLLVVLFVGLLLMTRAKRKRSAEVKRFEHFFF